MSPTCVKTFLAATVLSCSVLGQSQAMADISITPHDVSAAPGGMTHVVFDLDFGTSTSISALDLTFSYDPLLTLTNVSSTYQGNPVDLAAELDAAGTLGTAVIPGNPFMLTATWAAFDSSFNPTAPLVFSGPATVTLDFQLSSAATEGSKAPVTFSIDDYFDENLNPYSFPVAATATVTVVPEPETWMLALAGLGVVALKRARAARHA